MSNTKTFILIFIAIILVYLCGLPIDIMEVDAAQYATISYEMHESGNYLQIYCRGYDYLDKPPFLFWINQIFFFIFGVHEWSFKLGSLLFVLIGIYSTYQLGKLLYNKNAGLFAATILGSTQAWFLITQDVKTDGILVSTIIFTVWQWKSFILNKKWKHLILLSIGIAVGMLTKGPIGLVVPAMIMITDMALTGQWKMIFSWKYFIAGIIILAALSPMLYGLYLQYDLHPGKEVSNGVKVNSGLRFYFWTQSFGRITGESKWHNNDSFFYFLPEIVWAFLPWTIFIIQSIIVTIKKNVRNNIIPLAGLILPYISLSMSHYKLSHYIFICFPFIALMMGNYFSNRKDNFFSKIITYATQFALFVFIVFLSYCFDISWVYTIIILVGIIVTFILIQKKTTSRVFLTTLIIGLGLNLFLSLFIYPALLEYQSGSRMGKEYALKEPEKKTPLIELATWSFSTEFYAGRIVESCSSIEQFLAMKTGGYFWLYMNHATYIDLKKTDIQIIEEKEFENFHVTQLKFGFIWPATRKNYISITHLVKVYLP